MNQIPTTITMAQIINADPVEELLEEFQQAFPQGIDEDAPVPLAELLSKVDVDSGLWLFYVFENEQFARIFTALLLRNATAVTEAGLQDYLKWLVDRNHTITELPPALAEYATDDFAAGGLLDVYYTVESHIDSELVRSLLISICS